MSGVMWRNISFNSFDKLGVFEGTLCNGGRETDRNHIVGGFVAAPRENPTRIVGMIKN
jgi:hypothetical protein